MLIQFLVYFGLYEWRYVMTTSILSGTFLIGGLIGGYDNLTFLPEGIRNPAAILTGLVFAGLAYYFYKKKVTKKPEIAQKV